MGLLVNSIKHVERNYTNYCKTTLCVLHAKLLQSCLTLYNPKDCNLPASLSMGFARQVHQSEFSCPPPRDLPNPGMESASLIFPALAGRFFTTSATWEAPPKLYDTVKEDICHYTFAQTCRMENTKTESLCKL